MKHPTFYRTIQVDGLSIFYREAGAKDAPTLLLLHGLPSSSRMFEPLFSRLSDRYPPAPDYPGFGTASGRTRKNSPIRSITCRNHESLHRSARALALHTLHAGLRRLCRVSHGLGPSDRIEALIVQDAVAHNEGWANWKTRRAFLGRPRRQRKRVAHQPPVVANNADAPCRKRSQRGTL